MEDYTFLQNQIILEVSSPGFCPELVLGFMVHKYKVFNSSEGQVMTRDTSSHTHHYLHELLNVIIVTINIRDTVK